jgi:diguanylate cyclase (GGDEF)-like protein
MAESAPRSRDELVRLADLEWLDLSDLIRMDADWRHTLVTISRMHLAVNAILTVLVIGYTLYGRRTPAAIGDYVGILGLVLCIGAMAFLVLRAQDDEVRLLRNLRFVVFLSILAVSLMVFSLRDLQGDYYLLYLLPLVSAAGYLGFTGGMVAGVASSIAYAIVFSVSPVSFAPGSISALVLRALIFILVASLLGLIAERHLSLLAALRASHNQAIQLAITDSKTGLFNQTMLQSRLRSEMSRAERSKTPVSFLVVDVNGLDHINREHGYSSGDLVLRTIGGIIQKQLRATDVSSRWGVDEFGILLYNSDAKGAEVVAQRIATEIGKQTFAEPSSGRAFQVTISQGIAAFPTHTVDKSGIELVDHAYQAMRHSKATRSISVYSA